MVLQRSKHVAELIGISVKLRVLMACKRYMINSRLYPVKIHNIFVFILLLHIFDPSVILRNLAQYLQ